MKKKYDLIIAKPPYGKIGAEITKKLIDNVDYDLFLNILPLTNYRLYFDLQKHLNLSEILIVSNAFTDAAVLPAVTKVYKEEVNSLTPNEFRVETQEDKTTIKYFYNNLNKNATWDVMLEAPAFANEADQSFSKVIFLPTRLTNSAIGGHTGLASLGPCDKTASYKVAIDLYKDVSMMKKGTPNWGTYVRFKTEREKQNCGKFLYGDGFKFVSWLLNSMRVDAAAKAEHAFWFPKVDWTRSWTVKEILKEYDYTDNEIEAILESFKLLPEFKRSK